MNEGFTEWGWALLRAYELFGKLGDRPDTFPCRRRFFPYRPPGPNCYGVP